MSESPTDAADTFQDKHPTISSTAARYTGEV